MSGLLNALGAARSASRLSMMKWWLALNSYQQKLSTQVCKYRHTVLTSTYTQALDKGMYAGHIQSGAVLMIPKKNDSYSFIIVDKEKKIKRLFIVAALIAALNGQNYAYGVEQSDLLKLYAHSRIINDKQYQCFHSLITKESNWRVNAKNGSHYGLGQMRNLNYKKLDGFTQVDWSIRYITKRYGSMCNAWRFFKAKGYH
jgi:hypothetical protein